ncbi:MAG: DinB family protein [Usitatibacter sp.]
MNAADIPAVALRPAMESLARMPAFLDAALAAAGAGAHARRAVPGEFCLVEHACHLRDLEREGYLLRARRMLEEEAPVLEEFDGAAVAAARDYLSQDAVAAAREFAAARRELLELASCLDAAALAREGVFAGRRITLADLLAMAVDHDRVHRGEIEALLAAMEARPWK